MCGQRPSVLLELPVTGSFQCQAAQSAFHSSSRQHLRLPVRTGICATLHPIDASALRHVMLLTAAGSF